MASARIGATTPARLLGATLFLGLALASPVGGQVPTATGARLEDILPHKPVETQALGLKALEAAGDRAVIPALIELLRFEPAIPVELLIGVLDQGR